MTLASTLFILLLSASSSTCRGFSPYYSPSPPSLGTGYAYLAQSSVKRPHQKMPSGKCYHRRRNQCARGFELHSGMMRAVARDITSDSTDSRVPDIDSRKSSQSEYSWNVYVSETSSKNKEKGVIPTSSITQTFISLTPSSADVTVNPAVFKKQSKQKGKGHLVRCIQRKTGNDGEIVSAIEIPNVDSVDNVIRIMIEHMKLGEINPKAIECMKCYIEGNQKLDEGEPSHAISFYDQAFSAAKRQPSYPLPKGSILMNRARSYLKRAAKHRSILRMHVKDLSDTVPTPSTMKILYQTAATHPAMSTSIFQRLAGDTKVQQAKFRQIRYRHDMYEFALLHAVQDALQATQILPQNAKAWLLAGKCLAELRKLKESNQYYQRALDIDPGMDLKGAIEKNRASQEFMDVARASGFSGDTLRLALDVAA